MNYALRFPKRKGRQFAISCARLTGGSDSKEIVYMHADSILCAGLVSPFCLQPALSQ
jgi:hypothetical protein